MVLYVAVGHLKSGKRGTGFFILINFNIDSHTQLVITIFWIVLGKSLYPFGHLRSKVKGVLYVKKSWGSSRLVFSKLGAVALVRKSTFI